MKFYFLIKPSEAGVVSSKRPSLHPSLRDNFDPRGAKLSGIDAEYSRMWQKIGEFYFHMGYIKRNLEIQINS